MAVDTGRSIWGNVVKKFGGTAEPARETVCQMDNRYIPTISPGGVHSRHDRQIGQNGQIDYRIVDVDNADDHQYIDIIVMISPISIPSYARDHLNIMI